MIVFIEYLVMQIILLFSEAGLHMSDPGTINCWSENESIEQMLKKEE